MNPSNNKIDNVHLSALEEMFWKCFYRADKLYKTQGCSPSDGLDMYGYFKQATKGDINKAKPGMAKLPERLKWEAWNKKKGLPKDEAMEKYIEKMKNTFQCSNC